MRPDPAGRSRSTRLRWLVRIAAAAAIVYMTFSLADWMTFDPSVYPDGYWDYAASLQAQDVQLIASDGTVLHAWFVATDVHPALVRTIFLHGNAGNLTHRVAHIEAITRAGSDILILDYRGYGKSAGSPSEQGVYSDALAAYDWLAAQHGDGTPIICHGESIGAAVATDLATRRRCDGLILEAPLPSRSAIAGRVVPLIGPVLARGFNTALKIRTINSPVLIVHGSDDRIIPQELGRTVFDAAPGPKEFWDLDGAGHNDILAVAGQEYIDRLSGFYSRVIAAHN